MARQSISKRLNNYFFSNATFLNIGVLRILLAAFSLLYESKLGKVAYRDPEFDALHAGSPAIQFLSKILHPLLESPSAFLSIFWITGFCSIIGLFTRPALAVYGLLTIYVTGLASAHGTFNHEHSLSSQLIFAMAFIPGSTNLSADKFIMNAIIRRQKGSLFSFFSPWFATPAPVWGLKLIFILLGATYMTAGISKLRFGGLKWLDGNTLAYYLDGSASPTNKGPKPVAYISPKNVPEELKWKDGFGVYAYSYGNRQSKPFNKKLGISIATTKPLITALSITTVAFEIAGFLLLFGGWYRTGYLFGAILLHTSIGFLMGLSFWEYRIICLSMIDWTWLYRHLKMSVAWFRAPRRRPISTV